MKEKRALRIVYILSALSVFLPWFTYNPQIMGCCWGIVFLPWMGIPLITTAIYIFAQNRNLLLAILAEFGIAVNLVILLIAFGGWQEFSNICQGFRWDDGLHTAMAGYWLSALLYVVQFVLLQLDIIHKVKSK